MDKLRSIIVDDESLARQLLNACLQEHESIEVIAQCSNGREAIKAITELTPDVVFLDIQMPGISGLDVVKSIQADLMPIIIFTTAFEQFALDAFDLHAVDYVLKPINEERLAIAIKRSETRFRTLQSLPVDNIPNNSHCHIADKQNGDKPKLINAISELSLKSQREQPRSSQRIEHQEPNKRRIAIKDANTVTFVEEDSIDWIDAAGDYMCIHVKGTTHIMRSTMKDLIAKLDPTTFKRIHRSTIVNLEKILKVTPHTKGEYFLHLDCDEKIKVSRNYRETIKTFLSQEI